MENKINIAEILRDMPKGTKLYSPLFGKCELVSIDNSKYPIAIKTRSTDDRVLKGLMKDGRYFDGYEEAECSLFPSARMRDWNKFFKRGDVVVNEYSGLITVFDGWANDDYTKFNTTIDYYKVSDSWGKEDIYCTGLYRKATDEERAKFIAAAEEHYGGKYNPETLRVEPVKVAEPKCSFKPFDKVLVRCNEDSVWRCELFSHYNTFNKQLPYVCLSSVYKYCILYEDNQHLLGTTNNPE